MKSKFTISDVAAVSKDIYAGLVRDFPEEIQPRLKAQRVAQRHGTETRMFMFHFYDIHQPSILDFHHFGYALIHDPFLRYHPKPFIARFYANRQRIYDKTGEVISVLWDEMRKAEKTLHNFQALENQQMIGLFRMFEAGTLEDFHENAYQAFLELIPYWHRIYAAVIDNYGVKLTTAQIKDIISKRVKFHPKGPRSSVARSKYSRHIPSRLRALVFKRDGYACLKCGTKVDLHADHIIPIANGGITILDNLQTLCSVDNLSKGNRECIDYRKRI